MNIVQVNERISAYQAIERTCQAFSEAGIRWEVED